MKTWLIALVVIGIGFSSFVLILTAQSSFDKNCLKEEGNVTGFFECKISQSDYNSISKYDVDYDDLVTRKITVTSKPALEIISERNCKKLSTTEFENLPPKLKKVMVESGEQLGQYYEDYDQDGFLDGYGDWINSSEVFPLLGKFDFKFSKQNFEGGYPKQQDQKYIFTCIFEHNLIQFMVEFVFDTHYDSFGRLVFVDISQLNGKPTVSDNFLTLYSGGFNQTVVFQNNLGHDLILKLSSSDELKDEEFDPPEKILIPKGKVWSHFFRNFHTPEDIQYFWTIEPQGLQGSILLKNYPRCMNENEVKSLYSQVGAYPKLPTYLPQGYSFECGVHNMNAYVHLSYWTDDLRLQFEDKVNASSNMEFLSTGGIIVDYYNEYILSNWTSNTQYDKFEKQKEKSQHPQSKTLTILGEPAVMVKDYHWKDGKQLSYNKLQVFLDNQILYQIKSGLDEKELIKIAESIVSQT